MVMTKCIFMHVQPWSCLKPNVLSNAPNSFASVNVAAVVCRDDEQMAPSAITGG